MYDKCQTEKDLIKKLEAEANDSNSKLQQLLCERREYQEAIRKEESQRRHSMDRELKRLQSDLVRIRAARDQSNHLRESEKNRYKKKEQELQEVKANMEANKIYAKALTTECQRAKLALVAERGGEHGQQWFEWVLGCAVDANNNTPLGIVQSFEQRLK